MASIKSIILHYKLECQLRGNSRFCISLPEICLTQWPGIIWQERIGIGSSAADLRPRRIRSIIRVQVQVPHLTNRHLPIYWPRSSSSLHQVIAVAALIGSKGNGVAYGGDGSCASSVGEEGV